MLNTKSQQIDPVQNVSKGALRYVINVISNQKISVTAKVAFNRKANAFHGNKNRMKSSFEFMRISSSENQDDTQKIKSHLP